MIAAPDASLLTAFARDRDEKAFRILAERHFGLIFHTALRRTGNRAMAEDVSQEVLCILARKAAFLALHPERLASWLHRTTVFECNTAMRKESSQQRRLQRAYEEEALSSGVHSLRHDTSLWQQALPHLDEALNEIPESDRRIVLLHFFESLSFPRIAALLGKSPAAVQKQSVRALVKLNRSLHRKGVTLSVTVLSSGLAAESAKAVPFSLLPAFTSKAVAGAGAATTSSLLLFVAAHQKILVPCVLILLALPLGLQQLAIARAEEKLAMLTPPAPPSRPRPVAVVAGRTGGTQISDSLNLSRLEEEAWLASRAASLRPPLWRKLNALNTDRLAELLRSHNIEKTTYDRGNSLAVTLAQIIGARDHREALTALLDAGWKGTAEPSDQFRVWLKSDPADAEKWLIETQKRPDISKELSRNEKRSYSPDDEVIPLNGGSTSIDSMQGSLLVYLVEHNPEEARRYLAEFPPGSWQPDIIAEALRQQPYVGMVTPEVTKNYLSLIRENLPGDLYPIGLRSLINSVGTPENLDALVQMPGQAPEERQQIAEMIARALLKREAAPRNSFPGEPQPHLETAEEWLTRSAPDLAGSVMQKVAPEVAAKIEEQEAKLLKHIEAGFDGNDLDDQIAGSLQNKRFIYHLPEALKAAEKIQSPVVRYQTLWHLKHYNP